MIVGIMQPYLFPYLEQFRLMHACDVWVVFDRPRYRRRSWMNRNRILNRQCERGWCYFTAAVTRSDEDQALSEVRLAEPDTWRKKLLDRFGVYEHEAPQYGPVMAMLHDVVDRPHQRLVELNVAGMVAVRDWLGIETEIRRLSELDVELPESCGPGEWALLISRALGATEYRNPAGGRDIFDPARYRESGITLSFHEHVELTYPTGPFDFVPDLSVVDTMMWLEPGRLRSLL